MIGNAGIAIFMFGNKVNTKDEIVPSNGMEEEFKICLENGVIPIPIGATGFVSKNYGIK